MNPVQVVPKEIQISASNAKFVPKIEKCQLSQKQPVSPLLKTMNVRDTSKYEFEVIKYCREDFIQDPQILQEAKADINYDEFLMPKPSFIERISQEYTEMVLEKNRLNASNKNRFVIHNRAQLL